MKKRLKELHHDKKDTDKTPEFVKKYLRRARFHLIRCYIYLLAAVFGLVICIVVPNPQNKFLEICSESFIIFLVAAFIGWKTHWKHSDTLKNYRWFRKYADDSVLCDLQLELYALPKPPIAFGNMAMVELSDCLLMIPYSEIDEFTVLNGNNDFTIHTKDGKVFRFYFYFSYISQKSLVSAVKKIISVSPDLKIKGFEEKYEQMITGAGEKAEDSPEPHEQSGSIVKIDDVQNYGSFDTGAGEKAEDSPKPHEQSGSIVKIDDVQNYGSFDTWVRITLESGVSYEEYVPDPSQNLPSYLLDDN